MKTRPTRSSTRRKGVKTQTGAKAQTGFEPQTPFDTPEILDRILSHVCQRTLVHSAIFVNHSWLQAGRQHIVVEYAWSDNLKHYDNLERSLAMYPWMTRLQWFADKPRRVPTDAEGLDLSYLLLLNAMEKAAGNGIARPRSYNDEDQQMYDELKRLWANRVSLHPEVGENRLTEGPVRGLRELDLVGDFRVSLLRLMLPYLSSLVRLKLEVQCYWDKWKELSLGLILQDCRNLEDFDLSSSGGTENIPGPWILPTSAAGTAAGSNETPQSLLPLRSLVMRNMYFHQDDLEELVAHTPRLKVLRLTNVKLAASKESTRWQRHERHLDSNRLIQHLRRLGLQLDFIHISTASQSHDNLTAQLCHGYQERVMWIKDFTSTMVKTLSQQPNVVTTLDLRWLHSRISRADSHGEVLHNYLCSSPHLLHLKAPHFRYPAEHLDLHGQLPPEDMEVLSYIARDKGKSVDEYRTKPSHLGIWKCRNLKTLQIMFINKGITTAREPYPEMSRVVFGYISRVCPNLQELYIGRDVYDQSLGPPVDMRIQGGFCLLGRLRHLEKVRIANWKNLGVFTERNFEWMSEEGRTEDLKEKARKSLKATWRYLGITDDYSASINGTAVDKNRMPFDWTTVEPSLREELKDLGSAVDVKKFFDELYAPVSEDEVTFRCFPVLRYLSICSAGGIELPLERELGRLLVDMKTRPWYRERHPKE